MSPYLKLRIGISARISHPTSSRALSPGKTLLLLEQSFAHWLQEHGAPCFLIPTPAKQSKVSVTNLVDHVDALVLQGGVDVCPEHYGEKRLNDEWECDPARDEYEMALIRECLKQRKPILGICRGAQLLNVTLGGSLYQDIPSQISHAKKHGCRELYDKLHHNVRFEKGSLLEKVYGPTPSACVNSIHHQSVKKLGKDLVAEAYSNDDNLIEAIRYTGGSFAMGLQWHPEFSDRNNTQVLSSEPLLDYFLKQALTKS